MLDIVLCMEEAHLIERCSVRLINVHLLVESIGEHQLMCHLHPERLHRVARPIVNRANILVVKVADSL